MYTVAKEVHANAKTNDPELIACSECGLKVHRSGLDLPSADSDAHIVEWYCQRCSPRPMMGTCWLPLMDVPVQKGALALMPGTLNLPNSFK